jgi:hypothetical protein
MFENMMLMRIFGPKRDEVLRMYPAKHHSAIVTYSPVTAPRGLGFIPDLTLGGIKVNIVEF